MNKITYLAVVLFVCSCDRGVHPNQTESKQQSEASAQLYQAPSATELFELQSKCTAMGEKLMEANTVGNALTQEQVSHYNPKDNRCYVKLTVTSADLTTSLDKYIQQEFLFDGQTHEMLASANSEGNKKSAYVYDTGLQTLMEEKKQSYADIASVSSLINNFVQTDRRP